MSGEVLLYVFLLIFLLLCSAFFSASETAIFSLSSLDIAHFKQEHKKAGLAVVYLLEKPRHLLIVILFGNTLVNILFFSISTVISAFLRNFFGSSSVVIGSIVSVISVILFGEVIPKSIAIQRPVAISLWSGYFLIPIYGTFSPIIKILDYITKFFSKVLGAGNQEKYLTTKEFKLLTDIGEQKGILGANEREMLLEVLDLQKVRARELMIPRVEMAKCSLSHSRQKIFELFCKKKITKLLIYGKDEDDILGLIYAKEFLLSPNCRIKNLIHKIPFVPENMKLEPLLQFLQNEQGNSALIVDEYGGTEGFITMEDIVEELVGEIEDEYDNAEPLVQKTGQGMWYILGKMPLREWCEYFQIEISACLCNTISGFVTSQLQRLPQKGDNLSYHNLQITVLEIHRNRIKKLLVEKY